MLAQRCDVCFNPAAKQCKSVGHVTRAVMSNLHMTSWPKIGREVVECGTESLYYCFDSFSHLEVMQNAIYIYTL